MKMRLNYNGTQSLPKIVVTEKRHTEPLSDNEHLEKSKAQSPVHVKTLTRLDFYKEYKNQEKLKERRAFAAEPITLVHSLIDSPPKTFGILDRKHTDTLNLNHMKLGDSSILTLSRVLPYQSEIKCMHLDDNRITKKWSRELFKSLKLVNTLSLQKNKLGSGQQELGKLLTSRDCKLQILNLEDNQLYDTQVQQLMARLVDNRSLRVLNLSKNRITSYSCPAIGNMLANNEDLKELYLHYNCITSEGGAHIFDNCKNALKVLDMSMNSLGILGGCAKSIATLVLVNSELIHVDLSFNQINFKDTCIIAEALKQNKNLIGLHFAGNSGYVDSKGFLIPQERPNTNQSQQQIMMRIRGCNYIKQNRLRSFRDKGLKDCCWICEGWGQIELRWNVGESAQETQDPMFIHLSYRDFDDLYMGRVQDGLKFHRMLPPGVSYYFFTNGEKQCIAWDQQHKRWPLSLTGVHLVDQYIDVSLKQINYINVEPQQIIDKYYNPLINVAPREEDLVYVPEKSLNLQKWSFPISLFKDWRPDSDELLDRCFLADWNASRISRLIKDESDRISCHLFFRKNYQQIKDTYKHYASYSPIGDVWAVSAMTFLQLQSAVRLNEDTPNGSIKQQDLDLKFISTISGTEKGNARKPERGMIRFQFLELLVRVAEDKYLKNGQAKTYEEALNFLWTEHLEQEFGRYYTQSWREQRYWNEQCDLCMKFYRQALETLFEMYSKKKVKPGQRPFMCLQELQDLCLHIGLSQEPTFGSNIPLFAFNKAMMTQTDEINSDRIFQMSFVEFLEAFARIAEDVEPQQIGLHLKIERLIWRCFALLQIPKPDKSFFGE